MQTSLFCFSLTPSAAPPPRRSRSFSLDVRARFRPSARELGGPRLGAPCREEKKRERPGRRRLAGWSKFQEPGLGGQVRDDEKPGLGWGAGSGGGGAVCQVVATKAGVSPPFCPGKVAEKRTANQKGKETPPPPLCPVPGKSTSAFLLCLLPLPSFLSSLPLSLAPPPPSPPFLSFSRRLSK